MSFDAIPRWSMQEDLPAQIQRWVDSEALGLLVTEFGGRPDDGDDLSARLAWLDEFSDQWDFRRTGRERDVVEARSFTPDVERLVDSAAGALGLQDAAPPEAGHYDHVLILGGLVRACVARPAYAAGLLADGGFTFGQVIALGAYRKFSAKEQALAAEFLPAALADDPEANEYEAMDTGVRRAFAVDRPRNERGDASDVEGVAWRVRIYDAAAGTPVLVVAAPSSQPGVRRANTADTYEWLAAEGLLRAGDRVLLVTTDIYNRYQHADAIRVLGIPHDVDVVVAPMRPGDVDPRLEQPFTTRDYLQEIRSTIRALRTLNAFLSGR
jgi:hypothetical protein